MSKEAETSSFANQLLTHHAAEGSMPDPEQNTYLDPVAIEPRHPEKLRVVFPNMFDFMNNKHLCNQVKINK